MTCSASVIYEHLARATAPELLRIDVASPAFLSFRGCIRRLIAIVGESGDSIELADRLQYALLQWLSIPMAIGDFDLGVLRLLGTPERVRAIWGEDARRLVADAFEAYAELGTASNPLRDATDEALLDAAASCNEIRLYCHRTARPHFESLPSWATIRELANVEFLSSPRDYRNALPFDALVKVGPLRSKGFASLPGAVLNSPRFQNLIQIVWHGTLDDPAFGTDPVLESMQSDEDGAPTEQPVGVSRLAPSIWTRTWTVQGDTTIRDRADEIAPDDFESWRDHRRSDSASRTAVLFHLADGLGCLQAPHADILCLRMDGENLYAARLEPLDLDEAITHIVEPDLADVSFGQNQASGGEYAPLWKDRLKEEYRRSRTELMARLETAGIELDTLPSRIVDWIQPATNVIHAPKQRSHFDALIRVLGIESDSQGYPRPSRLTWSAAAWAEIARSRGEAIQHGTEVHELLADYLKQVLNNDCILFREHIQRGKSFTWTIPDGRTVEGRVRMHAIIDIEDGYRCPENLLKSVHEIERLLVWRA